MCNCGKNAKPTGFGSNDRTASSRTASSQPAQPVPLNGAQQQALDSGSTVQSFTLRDQSGRVQSFGSRLERNAFRERNGGTILS